MSQHSQFGPRPRIATTPPRVFGDIRDELGRVRGCECEPARRGYYSGTIMPGCPIHGRRPWFSLPVVRKEHWQYQGAGPWDGKRCYFFRREDMGVGGTTLVVPIDEYWSRGVQA